MLATASVLYSKMGCPREPTLALAPINLFTQPHRCHYQCQPLPCARYFINSSLTLETGYFQPHFTDEEMEGALQARPVLSAGNIAGSQSGTIPVQCEIMKVTTNLLYDLLHPGTSPRLP